MPRRIVNLESDMMHERCEQDFRDESDVLPTYTVVHDKVVQAIDARGYAKQAHKEPGTDQRQNRADACVFEDLSQQTTNSKFG